MSDTPYPEIAIAEIAAMAEIMDGIDHVLLRPLRPNDPNGSIGFGVAEWSPVDDRMQIGQNPPPINQYEIEIQIMSRYADEVEGRKASNRLANTFREMVFSNQQLHVSLGSYTYDSTYFKERFQRLKLDRIRYFSNEVSGTFLHLALIDVVIQTETS